MAEEISTTLEPPGIHMHTEEESENIEVHVSIGEADGTTRAAGCTLAPNATDVEIAQTLVACLRGVAEMRGPGLAQAIREWVPFR